VIRGRTAKLVLTVLLVATLVGGGVLLVRFHQRSDHVEVVAFFDNSNGVFPGDDVRIRGVNVGTIEKIEPEPTRVKITFWFDGKYSVPADADAVILSPTLVTARVVQLTPPYRGGPTLQSGAVIPQQRTAVPVEWDEVRAQLQRLADTLQPTQPGGVSTLGSLIHTTADNLRGQGTAIRDAIIKLSQAISILNDHRTSHR
jgi:phospholipid/cholesterol/gamma-HCH transport system substrate-binding protein